MKAPADSQTEARLYQEIGRLTMEVEYLKKARALPLEQRRGLIEMAGCDVSVRIERPNQVWSADISVPQKAA